jgi:hypothetical protein
VEQLLRLLHHCGMPRTDADLIHGGGATVNELLLRAQPRSTLFTGSQRVAEKLAVDMRGKVRSPGRLEINGTLDTPCCAGSARPAACGAVASADRPRATVPRSNISQRGSLSNSGRAHCLQEAPSAHQVLHGISSSMTASVGLLVLVLLVCCCGRGSPGLP